MATPHDQVLGNGSSWAADSVSVAPEVTVTDSWNPDAGGDWKDAADWSTGAVPGANDDAVINTSTVQTITYTGADHSTVNSLSVGQDIFAMSKGSLDLVTTASFADGLQQSGGTLQGGAIALTGSSTLSGGSVTGSASLANSGSVTLGPYAIDGAATLANMGTITQTGSVSVGDKSGTGAAIVNTSGIYDVAANVNVTAKATSASFTNAALLEKSGSTGTGVIGVDFTNAATGTISALAGNLEFTGKSTAFAGILTGPAEISIGAGMASLAGGTSIDAGTFGILGKASVDLTGSVSLANLLDEASGGNTTLNTEGFSLTLTGIGSVLGSGGTAVLAGSGSVVNDGTLTVSGAMSVGKTMSFTNDGTIIDSGRLTFGAGKGVPAVTNAAGATLELVRDAGLGAKSGAALNNAGTLAKISGTGTSMLLENIASTGAITSALGVLDFSGTANVVGGTIGGAGAVAFDGVGTTTLESGLVLGVAALDLDTQATLALAGTQSFAGRFVDNPISTTTIDLNQYQLALAGPASFGGYQATVEGSGTLSTAGTTTLSGDGLTLGGLATWQNNGTALGHGALTLGEAASDVVSVVNTASGTFSVNSSFSLVVGAGATASFTNDGVFAQSAPKTTVVIGANFASSGSVVANAGLIDFQGGTNSFGGTISGAGAVAFDAGGVTTLEPGIVLSVGAIDLESSVLVLAASASYAGVFDASGSPTLSLGTHTLALKGKATIGSSSIEGAGTLATSGTTILDGGESTLGGTSVWSNTGTFDNQSNLYLGDSSGDIAEFVNQAGGVYEANGYFSIYTNYTTNSFFTNAGTFDVNSGSAVCIMGVDFTNTGNIDVSSGILQLKGPTTTLGGNVSGNGTIQLGQGTSTTWQFSSAVSVNTFEMVSAEATLAANAAFTGNFVVSCGESVVQTITLGGNTLQLSGGADFIETYSESGLNIDGGNLVTSGSTTVALAITLGAASWTNTGTLYFDHGSWGNSSIQIGNGGPASSFENAAGAVFDIQSAQAISQFGSAPSFFQNDGLLEQTTATGTTSITTQVINNGTISVTSGTIEIYGVQTANGTWVSNYSGNGAVDGVVTYDTHEDMFIAASSANTSDQAGSTVQPAVASTVGVSDSALTAASSNSHIASTSVRFISTGDLTLAARQPFSLTDGLSELYGQTHLAELGHVDAGSPIAGAIWDYESVTHHAGVPGILSLYPEQSVAAHFLAAHPR